MIRKDINQINNEIIKDNKSPKNINNKPKLELKSKKKPKGKNKKSL